jgi:hypothetical protein
VVEGDHPVMNLVGSRAGQDFFDGRLNGSFLARKLGGQVPPEIAQMPKGCQLRAQAGEVSLMTGQWRIGIKSRWRTPVQNTVNINQDIGERPVAVVGHFNLT